MSKCGTCGQEVVAPPSPFLMGAKVRRIRDHDVSGVVCGWSGEDYRIAVLHGTTGRTHWHIPSDLELVPQPEPVEVGQWYEASDDVPHVVTEIDKFGVWTRRWDAEQSFDRTPLIDGWTRLDGPPEPEAGAVVAVRYCGRWRVGLAYERNGYIKVASANRIANAEPWSGFLHGCDTTTLRVLAVLDPA